ncbi:putative tetratricopeptide-like helical domain superfamily [Helianthus anomalus]
MAAPRITTPVTTNTSTPFHHSPSSPSFSTSPFPKTPHPFPTITIFTPHKLHRNTNFSTSVSGIWDAITGGADSSRQALIAIRRGMVLFRQGDVAGSVAEFDNAMKLDPRQKAYLWQRGLSLYYLDRFEEGAEQFRIDVAQNPNDTEESIWCFLCEAQLYGAAEARKNFLKVGRDPRPVMREAYNMFRDGGDPEKLVDAFSKGRESEYFYASLYAGLYYESQNEADKAKVHIVASCKSPYGQRSDDYMASLAKVHCLCRNWEL